MIDIEDISELLHMLMIWITRKVPWSWRSFTLSYFTGTFHLHTKKCKILWSFLDRRSEESNAEKDMIVY